MAGATDLKNLNCAMCLNVDGLRDPRALPCLHVFCLECLKQYFDRSKILRCPLCRKNYNMAPETLPSATETALVDPSILCEVCIKKEENQPQPAVTYCSDCPKLYCVKHLLVHNDVMGEHSRMNMQKYKRLGKKQEDRMCTKHADEVYTMGCRNCCELMCVECVSTAGTCAENSPHKPLTLEELVTELTTMNELEQQDERYRKLYKQMDRVLCDYKMETEHLVEVLQKQRDEQLEAVRLKYEGLEKEFLERREKTESDMLEFCEEVVGMKWIDLSDHKIRIETVLKDSHQVDIVKDYTKIKSDIQKVILEDLPKLELSDMVFLEVKEEKRDVEVEVVNVGDGRFSLDTGLTVAPPPTSMSLLRTVGVSDYCYSVCQYNGVTYVGVKGGVDIVDETSKSSRFLSLSDYVSDITVHDNILYTLAVSKGNSGKVTWTMYVHNLSGKQCTSWTHTDTDTSCVNQFTIVDNQIVIRPHRKEKQLIIYSLTGEVVKRLPCPLLNAYSTAAICTVDTHSVIVSGYGSSSVGRVDISTGDVMWTSKHVTGPQGVTCYRGECVLVSTYSNTTTIYILNMKTGELVGQISDPTEREPAGVCDLHISGDTLIVPRYNEKKVVLFQHISTYISTHSLVIISCTYQPYPSAVMDS